MYIAKGIMMESAMKVCLMGPCGASVIIALPLVTPIANPATNNSNLKGKETH